MDDRTGGEIGSIEIAAEHKTKRGAYSGRASLGRAVKGEETLLGSR